MKCFAALLALCAISLNAGEVTAYFPDRTNVSVIIEREIHATSNTAWVAMYAFTDSRLASALTNAQARGVDVRLIADKGQAAGSKSCVPALLKSLGPKRAVLGVLALTVGLVLFGCRR